MEVVINACFGGFNLSDQAVEKCIKRGMSLTEYDQKGNYVDEEADFVDLRTSKKPSISHSKYHCIGKYNSSFRTNPIVISVVKELNEKANGFCAELKIVDIPFEDLNGWEIDEYDGNESIVEAHRSWS